MGRQLWENELQEMQAAEREDAIKLVASLIKQHNITINDIPCLLNDSHSVEPAPSLGIATRKYDPFFDAW